MSIHLVTLYENSDCEEMIDAIWCCSQSCMADVLSEFNLNFAELELADTYNLPDGGSISWGQFPCGEESDVDTYCNCGELVRKGLL